MTGPVGVGSGLGGGVGGGVCDGVTGTDIELIQTLNMSRCRKAGKTFSSLNFVSI